MQIKTWLDEARLDLKDFSEDPGLDAQILLMHELGETKSWVLAHPDFQLDPEKIASLKNLLCKAQYGEPIPYIIGRWEFYALDFHIAPDVLIPRPETEMMVDKALEWITKHGSQSRVLDMGTGSGCIVVALAVHSPKISVIGVDNSDKALAVAWTNAEKHYVEKQIQFLKSDLFSRVIGKFDVICANLPYIPTRELETLPVAKYEPKAALDGGEDGLAVISVFLRYAGSFVNHPGLILCEFGIGQEDTIKKLAAVNFPRATSETLNDLHGISRLLSIEV